MTNSQEPNAAALSRAHESLADALLDAQGAAATLNALLPDHDDDMGDHDKAMISTLIVLKRALKAAEEARDALYDAGRAAT